MPMMTFIIVSKVFFSRYENINQRSFLVDLNAIFAIFSFFWGNIPRQELNRDRRISPSCLQDLCTRASLYSTS